MKRIILAFLLFIASPIYAADAPVTSLPDLATPTTDDLLYVVDDPAGTPVSNKSTVGNVGTAILNANTFPVSRWYDAAGCDQSTPGAIFDIPTAGFPAAACDTGTNSQKAVLNFNDSTDQSFQFKERLPAGYSSSDGISVIFRWKAAATTGAAGWCLQLVRVPTGATSDPAFPAQGAGNCVSDTAQGTTLQENEATVSSVTCTSCVAGDLIYARISRDADGSAVTDSMSGNASLIGFELTYRRSFQ